MEVEVDKVREDEIVYNNSREMGAGIGAGGYKGVCCPGVR